MSKIIFEARGVKWTAALWRPPSATPSPPHARRGEKGPAGCATPCNVPRRRRARGEAPHRPPPLRARRDARAVRVSRQLSRAGRGPRVARAGLRARAARRLAHPADNRGRRHASRHGAQPQATESWHAARRRARARRRASPPNGRGTTRSARLVGDQPKRRWVNDCPPRLSAAQLSVPSSIARTCPGGRTAWNRRGLCIGRYGQRPACAPGCQECARSISTRRSRRSDASMRRLPCNLSARDNRDQS